MRKLLAAGFLLLLGCRAEAACVSPLTGLDGTSTARTFGVTLDASTNCYGNVALVDGSNAANKVTVTAASALKVDGSAVTQPVSLTSTTITGTVASTQSGTWTVQQGTPPWSASQSGNWTTRIVGNAGAIVDFPGQNAASPANSILMGGQFNTTPTVITSGNSSPLQLDTNGNLLVNIKAGAGSGGTAMIDNTAFTQGTTSFTPTGCINPATVTNIPSGDAGAFLCTPDRNLFANLNKVAGTVLTAVPSTYGTAPSGTVLGVNAFVTNALASVNDNADAVATATPYGTPVVNHPYVFNGTTYDRARSGSVTGSSLATIVPTSTAGQALSHISGASAALNTLIVKASPGNLYAYNCTAVAGAAAGFCIAYNGTTTPATGALTAANVLDFCFFGTTAAGCSLSRIPMAANYSTGIVILVSSAATPYTYTTGTDTAAITADYN